MTRRVAVVGLTVTFLLGLLVTWIIIRPMWVIVAELHIKNLLQHLGT